MAFLTSSFRKKDSEFLFLLSKFPQIEGNKKFLMFHDGFLKREFPEKKSTVRTLDKKEAKIVQVRVN